MRLDMTINTVSHLDRDTVTQQHTAPVSPWLNSKEAASNEVLPIETGAVLLIRFQLQTLDEGET